MQRAWNLPKEAPTPGQATPMLEALPSLTPWATSAPAPLSFGGEIQDGRAVAVGHVVYQPREGGERDTGRASVPRGERPPERIGESAPHIGTERRGRYGGRGLGRRGSEGLGAVVFVPNFVPKIRPIMRNYLFRRRDSNPD